MVEEKPRWSELDGELMEDICELEGPSKHLLSKHERLAKIKAYRQQIEREAREKEAGLWRAHICLSGLKVEATDMPDSFAAEHEIRKARFAERDRVRQKGILDGEKREREAREEGIREGKVTLAGNHVKDLADIYERVGVLGDDALLALKRALEGAFEAGEKRERERWLCDECGRGFDEHGSSCGYPTCKVGEWIRKES